MPAAKGFYTAKDIMAMLDVGKNTAYEILHEFEVRGQLFRFGKVMRVRIDHFEKWAREQEAKPVLRPVYSAKGVYTGKGA